MAPGEVDLPNCRSPFSKVFAGFLESGVTTLDGECILFGSGNDPECGYNRPYKVSSSTRSHSSLIPSPSSVISSSSQPGSTHRQGLEDVKCNLLAFGLNTSFVVGEQLEGSDQ